MSVRRCLSRSAASFAALSLVLTPVAGRACSLVLVEEIGTNHMREKCRQALANPKRFLARVKADEIEWGELRDFVVAFDEGKYGCRENKRFVFRMLDSYYSVGNRKLTDPALLQRYAFNFPEDADPAQRGYIYNLLWLFTESGSYLPTGWTQADARAFVERPEHWPIAVSRFGKMRDRDDAVFASLVDPQSSHFDRQRALELTEYRSQHQRQRKLAVAELFTDPRFGPPDFAVAERLLPISAQYSDQGESPAQQQAREIWGRVADGYLHSTDPAIRAKGQELRANMAPPVLNGWPAIVPPQDGRVWLSPGDWPAKLPNPFVALKIGPNLITPNDYPSRALREERTGMVTLAARFGPDGKFASVDVVRSSGSANLDQAAASTVARRIRPKLAEMTIEGFQGREVMVPLLVVKWDISDQAGDPGADGLSRYSNGMLTVVFKARESRSSCDFDPSIFV